MLLDSVKKGSIDRSVTISIYDDTSGLPETGVVWNTAGIDLWYRREGAALVSIVEASLAALTTAHTDGGFLHIGNGEYRLDLPDAAFATGANHVDIGGTVTGMIVEGGRVSLVNYDSTTDIADGLLTRQMTEAYATDGVAPTVAQALFMTQQMLTEKAVVSTTMTVKKLDGTTAAATFTLDNPTAPTSITRAT